MLSQSDWNASNLRTDSSQSMTPMSSRGKTWAVGEAPSDIAGRNWLVDRELEKTYGPQYDETGLASVYPRWASADDAGSDAYAGISPYGGTTSGGDGGSGGSRQPVNMSGGGGRSSAGYNVAQSYGGGYTGSTPERQEWIDDMMNAERPTYGELPQIKFDEFNLPDRDKDRQEFLTEQAGAASRGQLRNDVMRRIMMEAGKLPAGQRDQFIRNALSSYGGSLAQIQSGAIKSGSDLYEREFGDQKQEAAANYQSHINEVTANANQNMTRLRDMYNFESGDYMRQKSAYDRFRQG